MATVRTPAGEVLKVAPVRGQLFVCEGCCCGDAGKGNPPVPHDLMNAEWERRRLRNKVHLTFTGCLGPCAVANTALLEMDGQALWFHSLNDDPTLVALLFDYLERALRSSSRRLPPLPRELKLRRMARFTPRRA